MKLSKQWRDNIDKASPKIRGSIGFHNDDCQWTFKTGCDIRFCKVRPDGSQYRFTGAENRICFGWMHFAQAAIDDADKKVENLRKELEEAKKDLAWWKEDSVSKGVKNTDLLTELGMAKNNLRFLERFITERIPGAEIPKFTETQEGDKKDRGTRTVTLLVENDELWKQIQTGAFSGISIMPKKEKI